MRASRRVKYSLSRIIYDLLVLHDEDNNEQRFSKLRKGSRPDFWWRLNICEHSQSKWSFSVASARIRHEHHKNPLPIITRLSSSQNLSRRKIIIGTWHKSPARLKFNYESPHSTCSTRHFKLLLFTPLQAFRLSSDGFNDFVYAFGDLFLSSWLVAGCLKVWLDVSAVVNSMAQPVWPFREYFFLA